MGIRDLTLGLGAGLLAATLVFGAADALLPNAAGGTAEPKPVAEQQQQQPPSSVNWKQAAEQAGMTVLPKAEYEQQLAQSRAEGVAAQKQEAANQVYVYIQPGMGTTDVALLLQAAGVLTNGNELIQLRQQQKNPIRSGTYFLPLKGDAKEVLKLIATPPAH